jgi:outer membrane cobalamin receptor
MRTTLVLLVTLSSFFTQAQQVRISGYVRDSKNEALPMAHIFSITNQKAVVADGNGFFVFEHSSGPITLEASFAGHEKKTWAFTVTADTALLFVLAEKSELLQELVVKGNRWLQSDQLQSTRTSTLTLQASEVNSIPVLGGEADLLKTIQLLPGVTKGVEGSTDLFVRGGAADQNLILLDGAPVYNTGHLFGFLSVFNPDILDGVEAINGAFPAQYGGRLSSIINVNTLASPSAKVSGSANIGLLASRAMVRVPIVKDKVEVWVAARRTYIDQVVKWVDESLPYYFYDINAKIVARPTKTDYLEATHYAGKDILNFVRTGRDSASNFRFTSDFTIANGGQTFLWRKRLSGKGTSSLRMYRTQFNYVLENAFEENRLFTNSSITDWGGKWLYQHETSEALNWQTGVEVVHHRVRPNVINTEGSISQLLESSATQAQSAIESSAFAQADGRFNTNWSWSAGLRLSSAFVSRKQYVNLEPRLAARYQLAKQAAVKLSYSRMAQYLHRVSSAAVAFPTDIWYPVTKSVSPQTANQVTLAVNQSLPHQHLFISIEAYYKQMNNLIGYREGTNLFLNTDFEKQLIQGRGRAWGIEALVKKEAGKLTGWISYTLSWSQRQYAEINNNQWFWARYDRRHNAALVANYALTKRLSLSTVFEFISGSRFTPIIGQYAQPSTTLVGIELVPVYAPLNSVKLANTHRVDIGLKFYSKPSARIRSEWFAGVYNVYNRATPIGISIAANEDGSYRYEQPGLFGTLPFVSYGFKF